MLIRAKGFAWEVLPGGTFLKLGKLELWLEKTDYKPLGFCEVIRDASGVAEVFALGRRLVISRAPKMPLSAI